MTQDLPACPVCGSREVVPVIHGPADEETVRAVQAGRAFWAGPTPRAEGPRARCRRCTYQWLWSDTA